MSKHSDLYTKFNRNEPKTATYLKYTTYQFIYALSNASTAMSAC